jgi:hypothetical protein
MLFMRDVSWFAAIIIAEAGGLDDDLIKEFL